MKNIPYGRQYIDSEDITSVSKALRGDLITTGKFVDSFEKKISKFVKCKYVSACSNGTAAIHLSLIAINLKKNDVVIMPAINFIAAYSLCTLIGAKIYLADVDNLSGQMTPQNLLACIKKNNLKSIKLVITMHMGGYPGDIVNLYKIKKNYNFYLIEDSCHAFGSKYKYKNKDFHLGSCRHSDISTFSMHPVKTFTTGEGGLITTNNKLFNKRIKEARSHGILRNKKKYWDYDIKELGFNYRLSDINCALGISQLKKVNKFIQDRKRVYGIYKNQFKKYANLIKVINFNKIYKPSYHLMLVSIDFSNTQSNKDQLLKFLKKKNILAQYHYIPIFKFSVYKKKSDYFHSAMDYYSSTISLPIYYKLDNKKIKKIVATIVNFLKK
jgi:dTDP-4-amino-4,6-dideoxygalactose transaminase